MSTHDEKALVRLAGAVGDGASVDWGREAAAHPDLRPQLRQLRALEAMMAAHSGTPPDHLPNVESPAARTSDETNTVRPRFTPGRILGGRYEIRTFLGEGGMGEVWLARDLRLRVEVALKTVRPERLGDQRALEVLRREVRAARQVASPNVCRIFDLVEADDQELVSMEYVDGTTLAEVLRSRGPLDLREASEAASQLLAGLDAIHQAGLVHRDIKPGNIMLTRTGRVVLMDFGLAKPVTDDRDHSIVGTRPYMAPEQLRGGSLDARSDIFAVGLVLAEMISVGGSSGQATREALWADARQEPPRLPDSPWRPVLLRAIGKDPGRRHPSAQAMARALEEISLRTGGADDRRPYPGLASFTEADTEYFFGREVEVEQMWRRLSHPHLQAIIGPSGAGKSSFLRAGLIPALPEGWWCIVCTPGSTPMMALAQALAPELAGDAEAVRQLPRSEDPDVLVGLIGRWRKRHEQALLIVDQFEELFTLNPVETQTRFAELLGRLALEAEVHVLLSMRDDFLFHCHAHAPLAPIFSELTPLGPPAGAALRRALTQPALKCGYRFEDDALVEEMLEEVKDERGALPLLAFAVARLWERRDRGTGLLTREAYKEIGGVGGALAQHAEATLDRIGTERQALVREIFRNLVTAQGTRAVRDREELSSVFPDRDQAEGVLRALIDARLLTSFEVQEGEGGAGRRQRVEIIHESLLVAWPRLVRWQTQDADGAQLRDQLRQAAQMWQERGHPPDLLWTGTSYREFRVWRERYPGGLSATEEAFCRATISRAEQRRRRLRLGVAAAFLAVLGIAGVIGWFGQREAGARRRAEGSRLFALGQLQIDADPTWALAFSIASLESADSPEVRRFALDAIGRQPMLFELEQGGPGVRVAFSPDGRWLADGKAFDGKIFLYASTGGPPKVLSVTGAHVYELLFGQGSDALLSWGSTTNVIQVWSIPDGRLIRSLAHGSSDDIQRALFLSADGKRLITATVHILPELKLRVQLLSWPAGRDEPVLLGVLQNIGEFAVDGAGERIAYVKDGGIYLQPLDGLETSRSRLIGRHKDAVAITFDASGSRLASGDSSGGIRVWPVAAGSGRPLFILDGEENVTILRFDPTGSLLASGHSTGVVRLWDLEAARGQPPLKLQGRGDNIVSLAFHPSGRWLATYSNVNRARLWPIGHRYARVLERVKEAGHFTRGVAFSPDGTWLAATLGQSALRRWPLGGSGVEPEPIDLSGSNVLSIAVHPAGRELLVGTWGGVELVPLPAGPPRRLPGFDRIVWTVAFSPDGRRAAAGGGALDNTVADRFVRVWDLETGSFRDLRTECGVYLVAFARDDRLLFVCGPVNGEKDLFAWNIDEPGAALVKKNVGNWLSFDLSRDGHWLLGEGKDDGARLHDLESGSSRVLLAGAGVRGCRFNGGGTLVVCGNGNDLRVIPLDGRPPHDLVGHQNILNEIAISPDDRWIASAGQDGTLRLWPMPDLDTPPLLTLPHDQFLDRLRSLTNARVVLDDKSPGGWRLEFDPPWPGWDKVPAW